MIYSSTTKPVFSLLEDSNFFATKMLCGLLSSHHDRRPPAHLFTPSSILVSPLWYTFKRDSQHDKNAILKLRVALVEANVHPFF